VEILKSVPVDIMHPRCFSSIVFTIDCSGAGNAKGTMLELLERCPLSGNWYDRFDAGWEMIGKCQFEFGIP
jgi:hypothetical protein